MKNLTKSNVTIMFVIIVSTLAIIGTNYIFSKQIALDINNQLLENEYKKIGGEENYLILQEIQKKEILGYLDKLKKEQPELIKEILNKNKDNNKFNILEQQIIDDLKSNASIYGNTGATITLIEFSDLECPFCIEQHNKGINDKILKEFPNNLNYIYKNFPLPNHKNSKQESIAAKCVEKLTLGEKYLEFLSNIYSNTKGGGEGFKLKDLEVIAKKMGVDSEDFNICYEAEESSKLVEKEFLQGVSLGINSVPSNVIINNMTGEFIIISEAKEFEEYREVIQELLK